MDHKGRRGHLFYIYEMESRKQKRLTFNMPPSQLIVYCGINVPDHTNTDQNVTCIYIMERPILELMSPKKNTAIHNGNPIFLYGMEGSS